MSSEEGSRITRSPGEVYPERGAFTDGADDADGASVPFQDRSAEVEPDAEAALSFGGAAADETLEDARLLGGRDARPSVAHGHPGDRRARRGRRDGDRRAVGRVARGVLEQVEQHLMNAG